MQPGEHTHFDNASIELLREITTSCFQSITVSQWWSTSQWQLCSLLLVGTKTNKKLSICRIQVSSILKLDNTPQKVINKFLEWDLTKLIYWSTDLLLEKRSSSGCHVSSSNCFPLFSDHTWDLKHRNLCIESLCCMSLLGFGEKNKKRNTTQTKDMRRKATRSNKLATAFNISCTIWL